MIRRVGFVMLLVFIMSSTDALATTTAKLRIDSVTLTMSKTGGSSLLQGVIRNEGAPAQLTDVTSSVGNAMLFYGTNLNSAGSSMSMKSQIPLDGHSTLSLSTSGYGVLLFSVTTGLRVGEHVKLHFEFSRDLKVVTETISALVIPRPSNLHLKMVM